MGNPCLYLDAVRAHVDLVLRQAMDRFGEPTPLLADGLDTTALRPARWIDEGGNDMIPSNLASQQTLLRTLESLSLLTGDSQYHDAALAAVWHTFQHHQDATGLLYWGGHRMIDLVSKQSYGSENFHELKCHYPFYELMWHADAGATRRFIEAFWHGHILDWASLDMNRHGQYGDPSPRSTPLWHDRFANVPVFFMGKGLSFINTGSDLFFAAAMLHKLGRDPLPLGWAKLLALRYVQTRSPLTNLGGYQFSEIDWGDRAVHQFGQELGQRAKEFRILDRTRATRKYGTVALCHLHIAETLGASGAEFAKWAHEDLVAYVRQVYNPHDNTFRAVLTDGTPLSPSDIKRPGYYVATNFLPWLAGPLFLWTYARAARMTGDAFLWEIARDMAFGNGLGDIGKEPGQNPSLSTASPAADPLLIFALLEMYRAAGRSEFLEGACRVADRILAERRKNDLFVDAPELRFARISRAEPLALLHLVAALEARRVELPAHLPGEAYFTAPGFGKKRTSDYLEIYPLADAFD